MISTQFRYLKTKESAKTKLNNLCVTTPRGDQEELLSSIPRILKVTWNDKNEGEITFRVRGTLEYIFKIEFTGRHRSIKIAGRAPHLTNVTVREFMEILEGKSPGLDKLFPGIFKSLVKRKA